MNGSKNKYLALFGAVALIVTIASVSSALVLGISSDTSSTETTTEEVVEDTNSSTAASAASETVNVADDQTEVVKVNRISIPCPTSKGQHCDPGRPRIVSMEPISDLVFDSSKGSHTVAFRVRILSPGYEFRPDNASCDFTGQWPVANFSLDFASTPESGDLHDGVWIVSETFPKDMFAFKWTISICQFRQEWPYSFQQSTSSWFAPSADIPLLPGPFTVEQTDPGDSIAPTVTAVLDTQFVDVSFGSATVHARVTASDNRSGVRITRCDGLVPGTQNSYLTEMSNVSPEFQPIQTANVAIRVPWNPRSLQIDLRCDVVDGVSNRTDGVIVGTFSVGFTRPTITSISVQQVGRIENTISLRGSISVSGVVPPEWSLVCGFIGPGPLVVTSDSFTIDLNLGGDFGPGIYSLSPEGCTMNNRGQGFTDYGWIQLSPDQLPPGDWRSLTIY